MYKFKDKEMKVPCAVWSEMGSIEEGAIQQMRNASSCPFVFHHTVLNADGHVGYGAPIGGVMATEGVVIPNFVGVDIGCGMCAQKTNIKVEDFTTDTLKEIMGDIRKTIPVGFKHRKEECDVSEMPGGHRLYAMDTNDSTMPICAEQFRSAQKQLGTLGGGNHFIEIQKGNDGFIWIMIHSGSRNLGFKVAKHYNDEAKKLNARYYSSVPKEHDLAFLPIETQLAKDYLEEMNYCLEFALNNRIKMMDDIKGIFLHYTDCGFDETINIHHNYAVMENHFGKNIMLHRKGATSAREGELGIIPGSQGTASYIVKGKGNPESFMSCSHGAGRKMGRKDAQRRLSLEEEQKNLDDQGILYSVRGVSSLDEAPGAYKDINEVMKNQEDLVEVVVELKPLGVIKG